MLTRRDIQAVREAIIPLIHEHMPSATIDGVPTPPRPDWTAQAKADAERLHGSYPDDGTDHSMGLTRVRQFTAAQGLPGDERYVKEFRRQLLLVAMRSAAKG